MKVSQIVGLRPEDDFVLVAKCFSFEERERVQIVCCLLDLVNPLVLNPLQPIEVCVLASHAWKHSGSNSIFTPEGPLA